MERSVTACCFTGHRPEKLPWGADEQDARCVQLKQELFCHVEGVYLAGCTHFICGMALGCDMYFAEAVLELRQQHTDVTLEAAIPFGDQPGKWGVDQRQRYNRLIDSADKVTVLQVTYSKDCMMQRNRYMVDRASLLVACFDGRPGGTMNTILYAQRSGVQVIILDVES